MTSPGAEAANDRPRRRLITQLWFVVLVAIAAGIVFGLVAPEPAKDAKWLADAFIQLIQTITGPVIFVTVVVGIASLGNLARAGGLALRALGYFFTMTVIALALGLLAGNLIAPGAGFSGQATAEGMASAKESIGEAGGEEGFVGFLTGHLLPDSFLGAFGGMAFTVAQFGSASLASLGLLMLTFWGTCAILVFGILGLVARLSGFSIFRLIRLIRDELLIIVGTSSSETVLPRLLAKLHAAGPSRQTVGMVIPTGYSFNLDGTCIYLTLGALFIVQAAGESIPIETEIGLMGLMILTSKGAAGITGAGLVTLVASLQAFGGEFFSAEALAVGIATG